MENYIHIFIGFLGVIIIVILNRFKLISSFFSTILLLAIFMVTLYINQLKDPSLIAKEKLKTYLNKTNDAILDNQLLEEALLVKFHQLDKDLHTQKNINQALESFNKELERKIINNDSLKKSEIEAEQKKYDELKKVYIMLQDSLSKTEAKFDGKKIKIPIPVDFSFPSGKAYLTEEGKKELKRAASGIKVALAQKSLDGYILRIEGHTDDEPLSGNNNSSIGGRYKLPLSNWELSVLRATSAVRYLQDSLNINPYKIQAVGWSQYKPLPSNQNDDELVEKQKNRRLTLVLAEWSKTDTTGVKNN